MKTLIPFVLAACLLMGCASRKQVVYKTLAAVGMSVDKSMQAAASASVAGKISDKDWQKIADAHAKFVVAYNTALDLAKFDTGTFAADDLLRLERELLKCINEILKL